MPTLMGNAADFRVVRDVSFNLQQGDDIDIELDFQLSSTTKLQKLPVPSGALTWNVRTQPGGLVEYEIYINSQKLTTQSVSGTDWHTVREAFDASILKLGPETNRIEFRITNGSSRLDIGDVTVWFRKQIFDLHSKPGVQAPVAEVADLVGISDFSFDLQQGGDIDRTLDFTLSFWNQELLWLLMWNVRREASGTVKYEVRVNGKVISTQIVGGGDWHQIHEAVEATALKNGANKIEFRVTGGTADLSVGDVALWFRNALSYNVP